MIEKRWLVVCVVMLGLGWSRASHADVTVGSPFDISDTDEVKQTATKTTQATETGALDQSIATFLVSGCTGGSAGSDAFAFMTPVNVLAIGGGTIHGSFTPTVRGTESCTVTMFDNATTPNNLGTFTVTGTGLAPQIAISPDSPPAVNVGSARINSGSTTPNFMISNNGDAGQDLTIDTGDITFVGNATEYSVMSPSLPVTIHSGGFVTLVVKFAPTADGPQATTMEVVSNDPVTPELDVSLTGTGLSPKISVNNVAFGIVADGASSNGTITITNTDSGTLTVSTEALAQMSTWFSFASADGCSTSPCTDTLTATSSTPATFGVTCAPPAGATGSQMATVTFPSDSDTTGHNVSTLTCTAGVPVVAITAGSDLEFGNDALGNVTAAMTTTITNTGNVAYPYGVSLTGAGSGEYTISGGCTSGCSLGSGSSAMVSVTFDPTAIGLDTATMVFASTNASFDLTNLSVMLGGTGTDAIATLETGTTLTYADTEVGASATAQTVTVMNTGNQPLTISSAATTGTTAGDYTVTVLSGASPLAAGASMSWSVACTPVTHGNVNGTFAIAHTGHNTSPINIALVCNGLQGVLAVTSGPVAFGNQPDGSMNSATFTLKNTGNDTVSSITFPITPNNVGYTIGGTPGTSLAGGASESFTVDFDPTATMQGGAASIAIAGVWGAASNRAASATETISGQGLTNGFQVFPSPLDFASVRFDEPTTLPLHIKNNSSSTVTITNIAIMATGTTSTNTFHRRHLDG